MFYFRIDRTKKVPAPEGGEQRVDDKIYREYTGSLYVGSDLATMLAQRDVVSIRVSKINQAAYVRATRPGE